MKLITGTYFFTGKSRSHQTVAVCHAKGFFSPLLCENVQSLAFDRGWLNFDEFPGDGKIIWAGCNKGGFGL